MLQRSQYIEPARQTEFQEVCEGTITSTQTLEDAVRPFFAVWKTNLMGSDLAMLKSLSKDNHLCHCVETINIQDDCDKLDPWIASEFLYEDASYSIWPREEGVVITSDIGVAELTTMLRERLLQPKASRICDCWIQPGNLNWCPGLARFQCLSKDTPPLRGVELANQFGVGVAAFVRDVIAGSGLALTSITMEYVGSNVRLNDSSVWLSARRDDV